MFQSNVVKKIKTHIPCSTTSFRKSCHWQDNLEKCGGAKQATDDNITMCMHFACWITKATDTLRVCNTYCFSTATVVAQICLDVMLYIHCLSWLKMSLTEWLICVKLCYKKENCYCISWCAGCSIQQWGIMPIKKT